MSCDTVLYESLTGRNDGKMPLHADIEHQGYFLVKLKHTRKKAADGPGADAEISRNAMADITARMSPLRH